MAFWSVNMLAGVNSWTPIGPEGAIVNAIAVDPGNGMIVYTTTEGGGTYKTTDGGLHWAPINQGLVYGGGGPALFLKSLALDPMHPLTLYAAGGGYVFKTTDGGANWNSVASPQNASIYRLVFDGGTPARVFALADHGVFKSEDSGASWTQLYQSPYFYAVVWALAVSPDDRNILYAGGSYQGLVKSTNGGQSWASLGPAGARAIVIDPSNPSVVYAGTYGYGVFKSMDAGASWAAINNGLSGPFDLYVRSMVVDPAVPLTLYAGTDGGGVFKTIDGGASWTVMNTGITDGLFTESLALSASNPARVYSGFEGIGVFSTTNGGQTWSSRNTGLLGTRVQKLATHAQTPGVLLAGVYGSGLARTSNAGTTWTFTSNGLTVPIFQGFAVAPSDASTLYVATGDGLAGLFRSTDGGSSWMETDPGFLNIRSVAIDPNLASTVYCSTYYASQSSVFKSANAGGTWTAANDGLQVPGSLTPATVERLLIAPTHSATIYALSDAGVYRTTDAAAHWSFQSELGLSDLVVGLGIDPVNDQTLYAGTYSSGLFKSANGGSTWSASTSSKLIQLARTIVADPSDSSVVYAVTDYQGVFKSVDFGRNWNSISEGLPTDRTLTSLAIDSADRTVLYVGVDAGAVFIMRQVPPTVSGVSPVSGPPSGGTSVTITGTNFSPGATVRFGYIPASSVQVLGPGSIVAVTPRSVTGHADVAVTNPDGQSGILRGGFEYLPTFFYTVTPCRIVDTRSVGTGGPSLNTTSDRNYVVAGVCGISLTAQSVAFNFAIVNPTGSGHITVYPGGTTLPLAATMNYSAGQIRANNAILPLGLAGDVFIHLGQVAGSTADLVIDVYGYFE